MHGQCKARVVTASARVRGGLGPWLVALLALVFLLVGLAGPGRAAATGESGLECAPAEAALARLERMGVSVRDAPAPMDPVTLASSVAALKIDVSDAVPGAADSAHRPPTRAEHGALGPRGPPG